MKKGQWVRVNQAEINRPKNDTVRGIKVQMMVSPSDIPKAVRADVRGEGEDKTILIEFRYLSSREKTFQKRIDDNLTLVLGKESQRIYSIEVDCHNVMSDFDGKFALEMLTHGKEKPFSDGTENTMNQAVIKNILEKYDSNKILHA